MSAQPKDGGPAFPGTHTEYLSAFGAGAMTIPREVAHGGMSLRDYFAAQAMQALVSACDSTGAWMGNDTVNVPQHAYAMADAMLAEREKAVQP